MTKFCLTDEEISERAAANLRACERLNPLELDEAGWEKVWDGLYTILVDYKREVRELFSLDPRRSVLFAEFPDLLWSACDPQLPIVYAPSFREFGAPVFDGGPSYMSLRFDPWTGKALPSSVRDAYFAEAEARLGGKVGLLEEKLGSLPDEFRGERWWIERGL